MKKHTCLLTILVLIFCTSLLYAQEAVKTRPSPTSIVTMKYEDTYVKITYSQPHKRGREIFGKLVPYGKVWRTGANEATEITVTGAILVAGDTLKAGTYSIYTIPEKEKWTVIFNSEIGQWGSYNYLQKSDVLRFEVPAKKIEEVWEPFTVAFKQSNGIAELQMMWDRTLVSIPINFIDE